MSLAGCIFVEQMLGYIHFLANDSHDDRVVLVSVEDLKMEILGRI